jgi:hypothetical protein
MFSDAGTKENCFCITSDFLETLKKYFKRLVMTLKAIHFMCMTESSMSKGAAKPK